MLNSVRRVVDASIARVSTRIAPYPASSISLMRAPTETPQRLWIIVAELVSRSTVASETPGCSERIRVTVIVQDLSKRLQIQLFGDKVKTYEQVMPSIQRRVS